MDFQKTTLQNGATLVTVPALHTETATVLVLFPVGSRYETEKINGISHFIEHMMFKGTTKRPSTFILSRELDAMGADYNAYTSKDYTGYYVRADKRNLETTLDIVSDMLWNSLFDKEELEREKGVIAEELHMYEDNPLMHIDEMLEEKMFEGSPLGWKIGGTPELVHSFTREDMVNFRDSFYTPKQMTVVVAGAIPENIVERVESYFGGHQREKSEERDFIRHAFIPTTEKVVLKKKETEQAVVALGVPAYSYTDANMYALSLLNVILGGTMSSRLFIEVRERRGLAYMVHSDASPYHEIGLFTVQMGLLPAKLEEAVKTVLQEMKKLAETPVTDLELQQAKDHIRGKMTLSLENSSAVAEWYGKQWILKGEITTPAQRMEKLDAVTVADIQRVAQELFVGEKLRMAIIGPFESASHFESLLTI